MRRELQHALQPTNDYLHVFSFTPDSGFVVTREEGGWLLWVSFLGVAELYQCPSLEHVLGTLHGEQVVSSLQLEWAKDGRSLNEFAQAWDVALEELQDQCDLLKEQAVQVSDRLKQQLMWAFDSAGHVDAERFTTILAHERIALGNEALITLVAELGAAANPTRTCRMRFDNN